MVRGAYIVQERKRAEELGYKVTRMPASQEAVAKKRNVTFGVPQDPICATKEDTDRQ
jgi:hypothetical protein